jgi:hypothetical protein
MNKFKLVLVLLAIAFVCGIFLLGRGITGMVAESDDPFLKPVCSTDSDCERSEVCCLFYESEGGVCDVADACSGIVSLTKAEKEGVQTNAVEMSYIDKAKKQNIIETILGTIIFISTIALFLYYISREDKKVKASKNRA